MGCSDSSPGTACTTAVLLLQQPGYDSEPWSFAACHPPFLACPIFFAWGGLTEPKTPIRHHGYYNGGYQLSLSTRVFFISLYVRSHKEDNLVSDLSLHKMGPSHSSYFSQVEQGVPMENYEEWKWILLQKARPFLQIRQEKNAVLCCLNKIRYP